MAHPRLGTNLTWLLQRKIPWANEMLCSWRGPGWQVDRVKFMDLGLRESIPSVQRHSCSNTRSFIYLGSAGEQIAYQYLKWSHIQRLDSLWGLVRNITNSGAHLFTFPGLSCINDFSINILTIWFGWKYHKNSWPNKCSLRWEGTPNF